MSKFEHKNGTGTLFQNDFKEKESHPDYKGQLKTPDGKMYDIAAWVKEGQKGNFLSLSIQEPYRKPDQTSHNAGTGSSENVPF